MKINLKFMVRKQVLEFTSYKNTYESFVPI